MADDAQAGRAVCSILVAVLVLLAPAGVSAQPDGDGVYPPDRTRGDTTVFVGAGGYALDFETVSPGADLSVNVHLTPFLAVTGRAAVTLTDPLVVLPVVAGPRFQFPLGAAAVALGPDVGVHLAFEDDGIAAGPVLGLRASYEYTAGSGFSYGFDLGAELLPSRGWLPGGMLKIGWEFH